MIEARGAARVPSNPAVERFKNGGNAGAQHGSGSGPNSRPNSRPGSLTLKKDNVQKEEDSSDDSL